MATANNKNKKTTSNRTASRSNASRTTSKSASRATSSRTNSSRTNTSRTNGNVRANDRRVSEPMDKALKMELILICTIAVCSFLFLCNFKFMGSLGSIIKNFMFGVFGWVEYFLPIAAILFILFRIFNRNNPIVTRKLVASVSLVLILMIICEMFTGEVHAENAIDLKNIYSRCAENKNGGGFLGGVITYYLVKMLSSTGTGLLLAVLVIICLIIITGKSLLNGIREQGQIIYDETREESRARRLEREEVLKEKNALREEKLAQKREINDAREREKQLREEEKENERILRINKKTQGVSFDTTLVGTEDKREELDVRQTKDDEHIIKITSDDEYDKKTDSSAVAHSKMIASGSDVTREITSNTKYTETEEYGYENDSYSENYEEQDFISTYEQPKEHVAPTREIVVDRREESSSLSSKANIQRVDKPRAERAVPENATLVKKPSAPSSYKFPPVSLLTEGKKGSKTNGEQELKSTAERLVQTLETFGVKAKITDVSRGPAVTRYELQPELGVKVSKIVGLTDDLKLALAATDIRIEAPIPGKSAVGIEVPNKENEAVPFRDLIESREFKSSTASLPFAVGRDIGGQIIVHDIAKMPHVLIAGATGSGKSVCINTIIMSILYKCRPEDVRLIMIDPKVVELSVYNAIPHLLLPVVTDPKKAAGALNWAVREMTDRYAKFADAGVRDLKGYNASLDDPSMKLPHILIIVDELADLMMVAPGEVEESICRLAQLARACGIHLVIATQRPSVDVITGLIKANMPSRVAFAVSSGVDSRTILDMVGAEKLLGKGDMLFYPQGLPKPTRVQGAFVPDSDVAKVVDFFKNLAYVPGGNEDIQEQVNAAATAHNSNAGSGDTASNSDYDELFAQAGRFIIDKDKASIGALQRLLKIGFNRAARIMDQLAEEGVVGEEQGTKPREILMNETQFEELLDRLGL